MGTLLKNFFSFLIIILLLIGAFKLYHLGKEGYQHVKVHGLRNVIEKVIQPDSVNEK